MFGSWRAASLLSLAVLAGCRDPSPFAVAVFVGADTESFECDDCGAFVRVSSDVDGMDVGTGSCVLFALTTEGQVAVAASWRIELNPAASVEWIVRVPEHLGSLGWNPVCEPTAEG